MNDHNRQIPMRSLSPTGGRSGDSGAVDLLLVGIVGAL
ncbi:hypothetical protein HTIA_0384 [Halorhabdus tiamatea SARL4B]|uniref:Uncharacterized protein n=1 Tax=Halorhabdus tiamatea SARL4B TaxID=1033806 RepID=S6CT04_9EURY|nr:hypothetical protein HTIA_0384 [Halorhabdus tiamatea SARL4B]